jgi:hypothetical protein
MNTRRAAIALLTFRPDLRQVQFYERFSRLGYTVFVLVDDNDFVVPSSSLARYLKIDEQKCLRRGYVLLNPMISMRKRIPVSAWEKALFFFGVNYRDFDHVWFFEDDVFIPNVELLPRINGKHPDADLLCRSNRVNHFGELKSWDWWKWVPQQILPLPWAASMACAIRVSGKLLAELDRTILTSVDKMAKLHLLSKQKNGPWKFLFIEYLFNTVALQCGLKVEIPTELSTVLFHKRWSLTELDCGHIYHPIKNIGEHEDWRSRLGNRSADIS